MKKEGILTVYYCHKSVKILLYVVISLLSFFAFSWFKTVHAASNPVVISLSYLTYNSNDLLINNWYSVGYGNRTFSFDYSMNNIDESLNILYNTIVLCSDSEYGVNGYSGDSSEVFNVRVSTSNYSCSYSNSSYTGGKVVFVTFESYSSGSNSVTVYQNSNASIQLIDFVVTGNGYVNFTDYSSETLINQNSHILNQNDTIISQNSYLIEQNNNTYDMQQKEFNETQEKLDDIENMQPDTTETPDDSSYQDYSNSEEALQEFVNQADTSILDIAIDTNTSKFIWDSMTSFIKSNSLVFSMFIALLSIGIIKLALNR